MTVLIGYVPTPVGEAALAAGFSEAAAGGEEVVILNSPRRGSTVDADLVGKLMMGSDAQRLLLSLDVPILAVKPAR